MFDLQIPFYKPLWLRLLIVAVCIGWAVFELSTGSIGWAILFCAAGIWSAYQFFLVWNPKEEDKGRE